MTLRTCVIIPTYDNPATLANVVARVRVHVTDIIVVDDGSAAPAHAVAQTLAERKLAHVVFRDRNGGKGAAVSTGLETAHALGFTHALQIDADGQHDPDDIPRFLAASQRCPEALVLGQPIFDESAPKGRLWGRKVSVVWCAIETRSRAVGDPLCGYRVYPVEAALWVAARGLAMDFDPEIAVRMYWAGAPIVHISTAVKYFSREQGGVSHFHLWRDTLRISIMHTRLFLRSLVLLVWRSPAQRLPHAIKSLPMAPETPSKKVG